jgi:hypothetical protein
MDDADDDVGYDVDTMVSVDNENAMENDDDGIAGKEERRDGF